MIDIRQSPQFANFMKDLGWKCEKIAGSYVYLRKFPLAGYFAKIPRPEIRINSSHIKKLREKYKIFSLNIAPYMDINTPDYNDYKNNLFKIGFKINISPFNPTTTYIIDLTQNEDALFNNFSEAKRRAVRRAIKNGITVKETADINSFINIRKKQYFPAGFLLTNEMKLLWKNFHPENSSLLLAYQSSNPSISSADSAIAENDGTKPLAGILLLFYDKVAYYWYASALQKGKKLYAPTLLVWEALKLAKKKDCKVFDFEGICDERFTKASQSWKGFTKFKEGFGGEKVVYMENFSI